MTQTPDLGSQWLAAITREDYPAAWAIDAAVRNGKDPATRDDPRLPYHLRWVWDGRPFDGSNVLVRCYHGLGDTMQFARYVPALRRRASFVTVEAQAGLLPLLAGLPGIDRLVAFDVDHPVAPSDCDFEIMELASALRLHPAALPPPYLQVPPSVATGQIGLCWRAGAWNPDRSVPETLFDPLTRWPCVSLCPGPTSLAVANPAGPPADLAQTASLIASLRLVITVDTMVAHLAGALNTPCWLLLKHAADWRWGRGDTSTWYPSMRLYRQAQAGDWAAVMQRVVADLSRVDAVQHPGHVDQLT